MQTVYLAEPYEGARLHSLGDAESMLIRQFQFPHVYDEAQDDFLADYSDRLMSRSLRRVQNCFKNHTGHGDQNFVPWAESATDQEIMDFLIEVLEAPHRNWTGYRILGSVHRGNGQSVWHLQLFRRGPTSSTKLYTGPDAPNVLPGPRS